jgi:hypothetical protein
LQLNETSVTALPSTDVVAQVAACLATEGPGVEMEDNGGLLRGAHMSSFGRKRRLRDMHDISACLCGNSAAPSANKNSAADLVCCRIAGCETKWVSNPMSNLFRTLNMKPQYHLTCVGLLSSPKAWTCEVCLSDAGALKRKRT